MPPQRNERLPSIPKGWHYCEVCGHGSPWREVSKTRRKYYHEGREFPCSYSVPKEEQRD